MQKLSILAICSTFMVACGGKETTKIKTTEFIKYETVLPKIHKDALNMLPRKSDLQLVKFVALGETLSDKSFNHSVWQGITKYAGASDNNYVIPSSQSTNDLANAYAKELKDAQIVLTAGLFNEKAIEMMSPIPEGQGMIILDGEVSAKNIMSVLFKIEEAAFYAGYYSAKYLSDNYYEFDVEGSKGLKIGGFTGVNTAPTMGFLSGYQQGITYWNNNLNTQDKKVDFISLGKTIDDYLSGSFKKGEGRAISKILVDKGADIILPVAGQQTIDTLEVIKEKRSNTLVVGVDSDQSLQYEAYSSRFLTSILKNLDIATEKGLQHIYEQSAIEGFGLGKTVVGTMENELIGLSAGGGNILSKKTWEKIRKDQKLKTAAKNAKNIFKL